MVNEKNVVFKKYNHTVCKERKEFLNETSKLKPTKSDIKFYDTSFRKKKKIKIILELIIIAAIPFNLLVLPCNIVSLMCFVLIPMGFVIGYGTARDLFPLLESEKGKKYTDRYNLLSENKEEIDFGLQNQLIKKEEISKIIGKNATKKMPVITIDNIHKNKSISYKKIRQMLNYIKEQETQGNEEVLKRVCKNN